MYISKNQFIALFSVVAIFVVVFWLKSTQDSANQTTVLNRVSSALSRPRIDNELAAYKQNVMAALSLTLAHEGKPAFISSFEVDRFTLDRSFAHGKFSVMKKKSDIDSSCDKACDKVIEKEYSYFAKQSNGGWDFVVYGTEENTSMPLDQNDLIKLEVPEDFVK